VHLLFFFITLISGVSHSHTDFSGRNKDEKYHFT